MILFRIIPTKNRRIAALCSLLWGLILPLALQAEPVAVREYIEAEERERLAQLQAEYGRNKELPPGFELQTLLALSHYPSLKDVRIRFIVDDVNIPLSSRPHWASMLRSASKRTYLVVIDSHR
ncbi:MAG: hypothetical protein MRY76_09150, partial [Pseudomonadales bacterium]|nr:hypothetical protein [Pseudomonadales bacterium]